MRLLWLIAGIVACGSHAWAQREVLRMQQGSVEVVVTSPFSEAPPSGYLPLTVRVGNGSRAPFQHSCTTVGSASSYNNRASVFSQQIAISVPSGESRAFQFVAPVATFGTQSYGNSNLQITLVDNGFVSSSFSGDRGAFIVATEEAMGRRSSQIVSVVNGASGRSNSMKLISLPADMIPEDSRAWFGVSEFWITAAEWRKIRPAQQLSLRDWVTRGGRVIIWSRDMDRGIISDMVKQGGRDYETSASEIQVRFGFGDVLCHAVPGDEEAMVSKAVDYLKGGSAFDPVPNDLGKTTMLGRVYTDWDLYNSIPKLQVNVPMTILFVAVFAILVGPVNLFVFANARNRYRMFWTTPLLSLGASLLLWVLIVLIDGFGAMGNRSLLVYVNAQENRASFFQEQVVRAGVLTQRSFTMPGAVALQPLRFTEEEAGGTYGNTDGVYNGAWFTSRAVSGICLETTDAFRGKVEIANKDAFEKGGGKVALEVISSLPVSLKMLEVVDGNGQVWRGRDLKTGQRQALELAKDGGLLVKQEALASVGQVNRTNLDKFTGALRVFYACSEGPGPFLETLPGIRWDRQPTFFVGTLD